MSRDLPPWVSAFDRVPVGYTPPRAEGRPEAEPAAIPLARRRRALAVLRAVAVRVLAAVRGHRRAGVPSAR